jgi:hypothetical protein
MVDTCTKAPDTSFLEKLDPNNPTPQEEHALESLMRYIDTRNSQEFERLFGKSNKQQRE